MPIETQRCTPARLTEVRHWLPASIGEESETGKNWPQVAAAFYPSADRVNGSPRDAEMASTPEAPPLIKPIAA
jgi:hypothetical protein